MLSVSSDSLILFITSAATSLFAETGYTLICQRLKFLLYSRLTFHSLSC